MVGEDDNYESDNVEEDPGEAWRHNSDEPEPKVGKMRELRARKSARQQQKTAQCEAYRDRIRPVLDNYRGKMAENPDMVELNTLTGMVLAEIESFDDPRHIRRAMTDLRLAWGHDSRTIRHEKGGDLESKLRVLQATWSRLRAENKPRAIEGEARVGAVIDVTPAAPPVEREARPAGAV